MPLTKLNFYQRNCVAININISKVIYPVYILNAYKIYATFVLIYKLANKRMFLIKQIYIYLQSM